MQEFCKIIRTKIMQFLFEFKRTARVHNKIEELESLTLLIKMDKVEDKVASQAMFLKT